jgi:hypothetical protein
VNCDYASDTNPENFERFRTVLEMTVGTIEHYLYYLREGLKREDQLGILAKVEQLVSATDAYARHTALDDEQADSSTPTE